MIEIEKHIPIKVDDFGSFDSYVFEIECFVVNDILLCAIGITEGILFVEVESGNVRKNLKMTNYGYCILVNQSSIKCLISELHRELIYIHYEDNFRVENNIEEADKISSSTNGCGEIDNKRIVYLDEPREHLIFFNTNTRKVYHRTKEMKMTYLFIENEIHPGLVFIGDSSRYVHVVDTDSFEFLTKIKVDDVSFDYSGKFTICIGQPTQKTIGLRKFQRCSKGEESLVLSTEVDINYNEEQERTKQEDNYSFQPHIFACKYVYGENCILGYDSYSHHHAGVLVMFTDQKWIVLSKCDKHCAAPFCVMNKGRDIYFVLTIEKKKRIVHLRNHNVSLLLNDPDEIERIEYLNVITEDKDIQTFSIVLPFSSFLYFKSFLL